MQKKHLFIVIDSLRIGGGEKSLVSLLSLLDYSRYDVDLMLFRRGGELEQFVPSEVNFVSPPDFFNKELKSSLINLLIKGKFAKAFARLRFSFCVRKRKNKTVREKNQLFWSCFSKFIEKPVKTYDAAIGYSQGLPTFYVGEKVESKNKICWINVYYDLKPSQQIYQKKFYERMNHIVIVSEASHENFKQIYPELKDRMMVIHDICNSKLLYKMSKQDDANFDKEVIRLLTVARLDYHFKGLDITANVCRILAERGISFKWYFVGDGKDRNYLETYIKENNLNDYLILLGAKANPYPYFKDCDIYVQTSRQEGWGISLVEARLFNRPVVTTEFSTVWNQMVQMKNGIVTDFEPEHIADSIELLINNKKLYNEIQQYQSKEKKGNTEEIQKVYKIL